MRNNKIWVVPVSARRCLLWYVTRFSLMTPGPDADLSSWVLAGLWELVAVETIMSFSDKFIAKLRQLDLSQQ